VVALAKNLGRSVKDLMPLHENNDPYYAGRESRRVNGQWFAEIWHRFEVTRGTHLRRLHYRLVVQPKGEVLLPDGNPYCNFDSHWNLLVSAAGNARHLGLVDADAFVDRRNPDPRCFAPEPPDPDQVEGPVCRFDEIPAWDLPRVTTALHGIGCGLDLSAFDLPRPTVSGYTYDDADQQYLTEIWVEKSTMNDVLVPICRQFCANLVTGVGYQSITGIVNMLLRAAALPEDRQTRIFYISDFDPAGDWMPVAVARQIQYYIGRYAEDRDVKLMPVALTKVQVQFYKLPRKPIKESDGSKKAFEERFGEGATELDALESLHPGELATLVRGALGPYRDATLEDRILEARNDAEELVRRRWQEATQEARGQLNAERERAEEILRRYRERVKEVDDRLLQPVLARVRQELELLDIRLKADLAPVRGKLQTLRHAVEQTVTAFDPGLPGLPVAETPDVDEDDWLYASDRTYLEQLDHYPSHSNRPKASTCVECGREFPLRRLSVKYCGAACRVRACKKRKKESAGKNGEAR
jgi:hypothetical protein